MVQRRKSRRQVVLSSDDETDDEPKGDRRNGTSPETKNSRRGSHLAKSLPGVRNASQPRSSGNLPLRKSTRSIEKSQATTNGFKTRSLESFYAAASDSKKPSSRAVSNQASQNTLQNSEDIEDAIEDDLEDVKTPSMTKSLDKKDITFHEATRKRSWSLANASQRSTHRRAASQKFVKTQQTHIEHNTGINVNVTPNEHTGPWTQNYAPVDLEELAVHPKKVADVREWLEGVFSRSRHQRLLVLKGPAGVCKTSTVRLLSKALNTTILEWHNPDVSDFNATDYVSLSAQFADFLTRAGCFHRLEMVSLLSSVVPQKLGTPDDALGKRLVLVEDLPNVAGSSSFALQNFRSQLVQYLASSVSSRDTNAPDPIPLVLVISESLLSASDSGDSLTVHRLLGRDILRHPAVTIIEFNPVAPTIIAKALKLALQKHTRATGRAQLVSSSVLQRLAEIGDVRNAISTLEYIHANGVLQDQSSVSADSGPRKSRHKPPKAVKTKQSQSTEDDKAAISLIALRESTLGLFHAVGRLLYNKRSDSTEQTERTNQERPPPDSEPESLLSNAGASTSVVLSTLYENYVLSCIPPDTPGDNEVALRNIEGCLASLCDADVLGTTSFGSFEGGRSPGILSEGLRQDEIAFHIGARGMQFALPYPVKRQAVDQSRTGSEPKKYNPEVHRMFYPMDIKIWRLREDTRDSLDYLVRSAFDGQLNWIPAYRTGATHGSAGLKDLPKQVVSQPGRMTARQSSASQSERTIGDEPGYSSGYASLASGQSAWKTMLLERLPYLLMISCSDVDEASNAVHHANMMREVERTVKFKGTGIRRNDESDDERANKA